MTIQRDEARTAKDHLRARLAGTPGVGAFGLGRRDDGYVITVTVAESRASAAVPHRFEGVDVEVRVSGPIRALGHSDHHSAAFPDAVPRPADA